MHFISSSFQLACSPLSHHRTVWVQQFCRAQFFHSQSGRDETAEQHIILEHLRRDDVPSTSIALLKMSRPPANAMGRSMLEQLLNVLRELECSGKDDAATTTGSPRCVVLCSSLAPKVFSAGADLKERATMSLDETSQFVTMLRTTFDRISRLPMPVIAAIDGVAVGGGLEIAMACDIRVASSTSIMGLPETSLAIVPGAGGTQRLPRLIGTARARELIYTGRRIDASTAHAYGLVQHVVESSTPESQALDKALEIAWAIAKNGPVAIRAAKWAIDEGLEAESITAALEVERQAYGRVLTTADRLEGLRAFKEGRSPHYKGH